MKFPWIRTLSLCISLFMITTAGAAEEDDYEAEAKLLISPASIPETLAKLGLKLTNGKLRTVAFYDLPDLQLLDQGVVLRIRRDERSGVEESTIKLRPVDPDEIAEEFRDGPGDKIEYDQTDVHGAFAFSIDQELADSTIFLPDSPPQDVRSMFSPRQRRAVRSQLGKAIPWDRLVFFGPIISRLWDVQWPHGDTPLKMELWVTYSGKIFLEASAKTTRGEVDGTIRKMKAFFKKKGIPLSRRQQSKTREVLEDCSIFLKPFLALMNGLVPRTR
jgi:hypothetical protein